MMLHTGNKLINEISELAHFHGADKLRWLGSQYCKSETRPRGAASWRHTLTSARLFTRLTAASYLKWTSHLSHDKVSLFYCRPEPWPAAHESESWCLNWIVPSSTAQGLLILLASFVLNVFVFISSLEKKTKQAAANPGELVFEHRLNLLQIDINVFWNEKDILFISSVCFNHIWFLCLALAFICYRKSDCVTFWCNKDGVNYFQSWWRLEIFFLLQWCATPLIATSCGAGSSSGCRLRSSQMAGL